MRDSILLSVIVYFLSVMPLNAGVHLNSRILPFKNPPPGWRMYGKSVKVSPDSSRVAYVARKVIKKIHKLAVVSDGHMGPPLDSIGKDTPIFSRDSRHLVYIGKKKDKWAVFIDGKPDPFYDVVSTPRFSWDSSHIYYVAENGKKQALVVDGKQGKYYDGILYIQKTAFFSLDNAQLVYVAVKGKKMHLIVNGVEKAAYDVILPPIFSPDSQRLAYGAKQKDKWHMVVDGREGPPFDAIGTYSFSPDSKRFVYAATHKKTTVMMELGKKNTAPDFTNVSQPLFSLDSRRLAYVGIKENKMVMVLDDKALFSAKAFAGFAISPDARRYALSALDEKDRHLVYFDGRKSPYYTSVSMPVFSPDSVHLAYIGVTAKQKFVVKDQVPGKTYDTIKLPRFSPDSSRMVYMAEKNGKWMVVEDGKEGKHYDGVAEPTFSPDSSHLAYWAKRSIVWCLVVDGREDENLFVGGAKGATIVFDGPDKFHTMAVQGPGIQFVRVAVAIQK